MTARTSKTHTMKPTQNKSTSANLIIKKRKKMPNLMESIAIQSEFDKGWHRSMIGTIRLLFNEL